MNLLTAQRRALIREMENARIDTLTGLRNTRSFPEEAESLWNLATRHGHPTSLAYLDLNNFKTVNDVYGHAVGNEVLRAVASTLSASFRRTDVLGRLGGDEFAVFLPETPRAVPGRGAMPQCCREALVGILAITEPGARG